MERLSPEWMQQSIMNAIMEKIKQGRSFHTRLFQSGLAQQFIRFGIVGFSNTILSYVLYLIFLKGFERLCAFPSYDYLASSVLTFCICTVWSFYWNNRFTFKREARERRNIIKAFFKTVISYSFTGLLLQTALLYFLVEFVDMQKEIVPLFALTVTVPLNFLLNKYWAFKD